MPIVDGFLSVRLAWMSVFDLLYPRFDDKLLGTGVINVAVV